MSTFATARDSTRQHVDSVFPHHNRGGRDGCDSVTADFGGFACAPALYVMCAPVFLKICCHTVARRGLERRNGLGIGESLAVTCCRGCRNGGGSHV